MCAVIDKKTDTPPLYPEAPNSLPGLTWMVNLSRSQPCYKDTNDRLEVITLDAFSTDDANSSYNSGEFGSTICIICLTFSPGASESSPPSIATPSSTSAVLSTNSATISITSSSSSPQARPHLPCLVNRLATKPMSLRLRAALWEDLSWHQHQLYLSLSGSLVVENLAIHPSLSMSLLNGKTTTHRHRRSHTHRPSAIKRTAFMAIRTLVKAA